MPSVCVHACVHEFMSTCECVSTCSVCVHVCVCKHMSRRVLRRKNTDSHQPGSGRYFSLRHQKPRAPSLTSSDLLLFYGGEGKPQAS